MKKENRGGKRPNAGRLPKYNEPTKTIAFRCPISKLEELKAIIEAYLLEIQKPQP